VDVGRFWGIIETARASARRDRPFHEALTDHLAVLGADFDFDDDQEMRRRLPRLPLHPLGVSRFIQYRVANAGRVRCGRLLNWE
jgi:hypothetical protein